MAVRDTFGREITYLRLSVTDFCNLRCRYCMPEEGVIRRRHDEMLSEDEMILAVETAASLGVRKVRITGGEPLVKKNILSICGRTAAVPGVEEVCLTTNGTLLPELAVPLRKAGVSRVNISLDTLDPEKYAAVTRVGRLDAALAGIEAALSAGFDKVKINTVLVGGFNEDEIPVLAELTRDRPVDVRFIELMPTRGQSGFGPEAFIPNGRVLAALPDLIRLPDEEGTAELWQLPGAAGRIGLISPVYRHFCRKCNRLRLTADGKLKPCLHSADEYPIKGLSPSEMREQFLRAIAEKPEMHADFAGGERSGAARSMNRIGG